MEKVIDQTALSGYDGKDGRPAYISYGGDVIDVSTSPMWKGGVHMGRHHAGKDLTTEIQAAPHGPEVVDRYPRIGTLSKRRQGKAEGEHGASLPASFFTRFPLLRRHPHPVMAHFPIVFTLSAAFFSLLYLATRDHSFEKTAFYCLIGSLVFTPPAILTGFLTWWINYSGRPVRRVTLKKYLSFVMLSVLSGLVTWRFFVPDILSGLSVPGSIYLLLLIVSSALVLAIGYLGGMLTFPLEKG